MHPIGQTRESCALQLAAACEALDQYDNIAFHEELKKMRYSSEFLGGVLTYPERAAPLPEYTMDDLRTLEREPMEELPILGRLGFNVFIKGRTHCVTAKPNVGKTEMLAQSACYWDLPVLIITEDSTEVWLERAIAYASAGLPNNPRLTIVPALTAGRSFVERMIRQAEPESVVIVDTLRAFAGVEDEASGSQWTTKVDPWVKMAKDRQLTLICVHHNRKGTESDDPSESASGSNSLMSRFEQRITMRSTRGMKMVSGQAKNWQVKPCYMRWEGACLVTADSEELKTQGSTLEALVLQMLSPSQPSTVRQLVQGLTENEVDADDATVRVMLNRLRQSGKAQNTSKAGAGRWVSTVTNERANAVITA